MKLDTPDTEVVEAADPGTGPEPMDLSDEPAAMDDDFAVADEPAAMDDDFAVADEPAALDDDFAVADGPAAMDDDFAVADEPAAMDNEVEKPVEGGEPPVADDTPAAEGAMEDHHRRKRQRCVYGVRHQRRRFPEDSAARSPMATGVGSDGRGVLHPTNIYHFWLKKMSSYDLADIRHRRRDR